MNTDQDLLYGYDHEENIVAVEMVSGKSVVEVFKRVNGKVIKEYRPTDYIIYVNDQDKVAQSNDSEFLLGSNFYNTIIRNNDIRKIYDIKRDAEHSYMPMANSQYLLKTGKTLFKGMELNDLKVFGFDIEVYTPEGFKFPNARRRSDKITIITIKTNTGFDIILASDDEVYLLKTFIKLVLTEDPDVLTFFNGNNFDMNYIYDRCDLLGIQFQIGRNQSVPEKFTTSMKAADKSIEYTNWKVYGRHVIDCYLLVILADVTTRMFENYGLKQIMKDLGKAKEDRTYIDGDKISWYWDNDRETLLKYAMDDTEDVMFLFFQYAVPFFKMTTMTPLGFQDVARLGTSTKIDLIFVREYYKEFWSLGRPDDPEDFGGGYADCFFYGILNDPSCYLDVRSLYPELYTLLNITLPKDELRVGQRLSDLMKVVRFELKATAASASGDKKVQLKGTDSSVKILLNTLDFGYVGYEHGLFNNYPEARRITSNGQRVIKSMIYIVLNLGGTPIKCDTDGLMTTRPKQFETNEEFRSVVEAELNKMIHEGLFDGKFDSEILDIRNRTRNGLGSDCEQEVVCNEDEGEDDNQG